LALLRTSASLQLAHFGRFLVRDGDLVAFWFAFGESALRSDGRRIFGLTNVI